MDSTNIMMTLYAVRNKDGKWFHAKGYSGSGATWVESLTKAKIYPKIGQARARVSYFAKNYPAYGVPEIVELYVTTSKVLDETKRVKKAQDARAKKEADHAKRMAEWKLDQAKMELTRAQKMVADLEAEKNEDFISTFDRAIGSVLRVDPRSAYQ